MIIRKIYGSKARFCNENCADGFKCDREHNLIYGPYLVYTEDKSDGKLMDVEEASIAADFCAYCGADSNKELESENFYQGKALKKG